MSDFDPAEARLLALLEAITFASPRAGSGGASGVCFGQTSERIRALADRLAAEFAAPHHGLMLRSLAGGYQLITKPEHHQELRELVENLPPPAPLSKAAVETAAIIALQAAHHRCATTGHPRCPQ